MILYVPLQSVCSQSDWQWLRPHWIPLVIKLNHRVESPDVFLTESSPVVGRGCEGIDIHLPQTFIDLDNAWRS